MVDVVSSSEKEKGQDFVSPAPVLPETAPEVSPLEELKKLNEENKKIFAEIKEERKKMEKTAAELLVSGRSFAGQAPPKPETADEKWKREAKERYKGTGMDPT